VWFALALARALVGKAVANQQRRRIVKSQSCRRSYLTVALIVGLTWVETSAQDKGDPKPKELRVLFLGNSQCFASVESGKTLRSG